MHFKYLALLLIFPGRQRHPPPQTSCTSFRIPMPPDRRQRMPSEPIHRSSISLRSIKGTRCNIVSTL